MYYCTIFTCLNKYRCLKVGWNVAYQGHKPLPGSAAVHYKYAYKAYFAAGSQKEEAGIDVNPKP